jgi:hypothetical protein
MNFEIETKEILKILNEIYKNEKIKVLKIENLKGGFISKIFRVKFNLNEKLKDESLIFKFSTEDFKEFFLQTREILFYKEFLKLISNELKVPKYIYSKINLKNDKGILILEDLKNYKIKNFKNGLNFFEIKLILKEISKLHYFFLNKPNEIEKILKKFDLNFDKLNKLDEKLFKILPQNILNNLNFKKLFNEKDIEQIKNLLNNYKNYFNFKFKNLTIINNDLWMNNILFHKEKEKFKIILLQ